MSTRHERRKRAKKNAERKLEGLAQAAIAARTNAIVRANMAKPIERNYYAGIRSSVALCESAGARHGGHSRTQVRLGKIVKGKFIPA